MKKVITVIFLIVSLASYGQKGRFNPFKLIVIKPDTAIIDKSLYGDIDSVQSDYQKRYYSFLKQMEDLLNFDSFPKEMATHFNETKERLKKQIPIMKSQESEVKKFKYYHTISRYSAEVYDFYFNEYEPFSSITEFSNQNYDSLSLIKLADTSKADYIVFFTNVHTETKDGGPVLMLTTSLYSKNDNKIILTRQTEGDTNSRGDMWTCGSTPLSCLLINGVRTSTEQVAPEIAKRQLRR